MLDSFYFPSQHVSISEAIEKVSQEENIVELVKSALTKKDKDYIFFTSIFRMVNDLIKLLDGKQFQLRFSILEEVKIDNQWFMVIPIIGGEVLESSSESLEQPNIIIPIQNVKYIDNIFVRDSFNKSVLYAIFHNGNQYNNIAISNLYVGVELQRIKLPEDIVVLCVTEEEYNIINLFVKSCRQVIEAKIEQIDNLHEFENAIYYNFINALNNMLIKREIHSANHHLLLLFMDFLNKVINEDNIYYNMLQRIWENMQEDLNIFSDKNAVQLAYVISSISFGLLGEYYVTVSALTSEFDFKISDPETYDDFILGLSKALCLFIVLLFTKYGDINLDVSKISEYVSIEPYLEDNKDIVDVERYKLVDSFITNDSINNMLNIYNAEVEKINNMFRDRRELSKALSESDTIVDYIRTSVLKIKGKGGYVIKSMLSTLYQDLNSDRVLAIIPAISQAPEIKSIYANIFGFSSLHTVAPVNKLWEVYPMFLLMTADHIEGPDSLDVSYKMLEFLMITALPHLYMSLLLVKGGETATENRGRSNGIAALIKKNLSDENSQNFISFINKYKFSPVFSLSILRYLVGVDYE
jgi:hypothetical protein